MDKKDVLYNIPATHGNSGGMPPAAAACSGEISCVNHKTNRDLVRGYKLPEQEALYAIQVLKEEVAYLNRLYEEAGINFWDDEHLVDVSFVMNQTDASSAALL